MKIKLSIQEIVNDFYSLAEKEGYLNGLTEHYELNDKDKKEYHLFMKTLMNKYMPKWKSKIKKEYWETEYEDEKGLILSTTLYKNFKEIFCQLI